MEKHIIDEVEVKVKEYKVGEVFEIRKRKFKCCQVNSKCGACDECAFEFRSSDSIVCDLMTCQGYKRKDKIDVYFIEVTT